MRISFDVDDTLVCSPSTPTEQFVSWWKRWLYSEPLRQGTRDLMGTLIADGHQVWIYTTSLRSSRYLFGWFRSMGIRLGGVVNQQRHEKTVGRHGPSKYPPAFGIDLHVDDSEGVGEEGKMHRFQVVVVSPQDVNWVARVLQATGRQTDGRLDNQEAAR
jgi:hypothetical protein